MQLSPPGLGCWAVDGRPSAASLAKPDAIHEHGPLSSDQLAEIGTVLDSR